MTRRKKHPFLRILSFTGRLLPAYLSGVLVWGATIAFCFNIVMALVFQDVMNASSAGNQGLLIRGVVLALGTFVLGIPVCSFARYAFALSFYRAKTAAREALFSRAVSLPLARVEGVHSGDFITRSTNDLDAAFGTLNVLFDFSTALSMGVIGFGILFALSWELGLVGLALGLLLLALSIPASRIMRRRSDALQSSLGTVTERLSDLLAGVLVTRMLGREDRVLAAYADASSGVAVCRMRHARSQAAFDAAQGFVSWVQSTALLALALVLFHNGVILVGAVWAVVRIQGNASWLFQSLGQSITAIQKGIVGSRRLFEVLDEAPERSGAGAAAADLAGLPCAVSLRGVAFQYGQGGEARPALRGVTFSVREGEVVALVGTSGGGKSTLVKLLLGLYPDFDGEIRVCGMNMCGTDVAQIRGAIAYVPQDAYLFDGTIEENIAMGRPGATHEEVVQAAMAAHAHEFILRQPESYETRVGERGAKLSGGERQRIAIARALLKDAPVLLLDEATSALDAESERLVQEALDVLMRGRTTLAVAHRLSTIRAADRILVMDGGRIVEEGTHGELLAAGGTYASLHAAQEAVPALAPAD